MTTIQLSDLPNYVGENRKYTVKGVTFISTLVEYDANSKRATFADRKFDLVDTDVLGVW